MAENRLMGLATIRSNGWPQNTMVSYASEDILIYFIVSRQSQKFANIERDDRVSIAIGRGLPRSIHDQGLSIAARASEVRDPEQRQRAVHLLLNAIRGFGTGTSGAEPFRGHAGKSRNHHDPRTMRRALATRICLPWGPAG